MKFCDAKQTNLRTVKFQSWVSILYSAFTRMKIEVADYERKVTRQAKRNFSKRRHLLRLKTINRVIKHGIKLVILNLSAVSFGHVHWIYDVQLQRIAL